jgi:hypothetical protein
MHAAAAAAAHNPTTTPYHTIPYATPVQNQITPSDITLVDC